MSKDYGIHNSAPLPPLQGPLTSGQPPMMDVREKDMQEESATDLNRTRQMDVRTKQVFKGRYLFWLAYQSVGVIYGDIGTSPLYVYSSTFTSNPSYDDLLGALSLIIWTLTLMVSVKYILIVLRADDEGEGGTFAVYSLLSRYVRSAPPLIHLAEAHTRESRRTLSAETLEKKDPSKWNESTPPISHRQASILDPSSSVV